MGGSTRLADWSVAIGGLPRGRTNSVLDVPGVGLGHATVISDDSEPPTGSGIGRTGVTVLDPGGDVWAAPVPAGVSVLNGAGELTGRSQIEEWGVAESPVFLTSTMQVGRVYDAACRLLIDEQPRIGVDEVLIPIVGECDDSWLNDARRMHVRDGDVASALAAARRSIGGGDVALGAVGAGTGMACFGWKGGIGTASRLLPDGHVVAALVLANFGHWERLTIAGVPVGRMLGPPPDLVPPPAGSCIGVVITDAPIDAAGCARLAARMGLGLARTGSTAHHGSGEIFLGLATGLRADRSTPAASAAAISGTGLDAYFEATVDATEEAVIDALLAATTTTGVGGRTIHALPHDRVRALVAPA
ncbi:S58 family peptidase [Mycolicibacterium moriokaense]|nr:S58 family peptidase [Mycolicibacterium moriokaense]